MVNIENIEWHWSHCLRLSTFPASHVVYWKTIRNGVLSGEPQHYDINSRKMLTPDVGPGPDLYDLLTICYHSKLPLPLPLPLSSLLLVSLATRRWIKLCRSRRRTGTWRCWRSSSGRALPSELSTNLLSCPTKSRHTPEKRCVANAVLICRKFQLRLFVYLEQRFTMLPQLWRQWLCLHQ